MIDVYKIREDFPILSKKINNTDLIYLDNAATSQTPIQVIDAISDYYKNYNSNIHRGLHSLSVDATNKFEETRLKVKEHFGIAHTHEIIFTSGTTHGINIISSGLEKMISSKDELIVSEMEHHSNIVPWQMLCEKTGSKLKVIPIKDDGTLNIDEYKSLLTPNVKFVFINHVSNTLGIVNPIKEIIDLAHANKSQVLVDGAQGAAHFKINLSELDVDYYVASAHKLCGPTGVGFLYGKSDLLNSLPPYQGGGEMISNVTFNKTEYADLPHKFEAGTPNIAGVIAFGSALDYMNSIGFDNIESYEKTLLDYATESLKKITNLKIYGDIEEKISVISFNVGNHHPSDIGSILDQFGIAVRTGQHCTQPIMDRFNIPGTVRASFSFYNTKSEIDLFVDAVKKASKMLG
ncbi:cysteine desulfurase [Flavobacteriaceae bacterium]|jgi:cysteine desulfurase/selenocysteine lyase|nr:cysteine desulfurase [Cryomorphaceae bacterium]MDA8630500.1 cysteine desulfurase [Flavobacteriaceae bacterium]MBT7694912.1 cysteine desulfurase [Cryomorphaceae bacterium]MDA8703999.1 cysteine desulfurase [Flavobacteriaceae bacterium]MDA9276278.1 cysteine desulfurase [Flavobacteriaceae bacterium]|tara:strand:+ start:1300 stop:2514 length:1215 start_codon:yes stop_codon:yes gene_type:complete